MNFRIILFFAFTCLYALNAHSQEVTERAIPAKETAKIMKGEAVDFQKTLRRLEVAFKEGDVKSANKIKGLLEKTMKKRVDAMEAASSKSAEQANTLEKQQTILKDIKQFKFTGNKEDYRNSLEHVRKLQQFALLMEK